MTFAGIVDALGSIALAILGLLVLRIKPRTRANIAFAVFSIAFGLAFIYNLDDPRVVGPLDVLWPLSAIAILVATAAGVAVLATIPRPLDRRERGQLAWLAALQALIALGLAWHDIPIIERLVAGAALWFKLGVYGIIIGYQLLGATLLFGVVFLASRLRTHHADDRTTGQMMLMAIGVGAWPAFVAGNYIVSSTHNDTFTAAGLGGAALVLVAAGAWLAAGEHTGRRREARTVALSLLAIWVLGGITRVLPGGMDGGNDGGAFGFSRVIGVSILAYAVLRTQLLGIDVKLRFAISKSTIAAVFIAVFFIASETAQQFFGETLGSTYVGIAAAGALVFAMAPLQRVAERLALRAVPIVAGAESPDSASRIAKEESYKRAIRNAIRDRTLTREEELHLHELAEHLGIGAGRAMALRIDVEGEFAREAV